MEFNKEKTMLCKLLPFILAAVPLAAAASEAPQIQETFHDHVSAEQLKSWYDQNKEMVVLDARSKPYFNGTLLPNARWLPAESTDKEIEAAVPSKESLIVVYCHSETCPASGWLYDKLSKLGYKNVYEYHEGLVEWMKLGFPTIKQPNFEQKK
jgi:rhodanese-related sulfurtransferase